MDKLFNSKETVDKQIFMVSYCTGRVWGYFVVFAIARKLNVEFEW